MNALERLNIAHRTRPMFIIYIADNNLYVCSATSFTSNRDSALEIPTQRIADDWLDWMADRHFIGATWRVVPK